LLSRKAKAEGVGLLRGKRFDREFEPECAENFDEGVQPRVAAVRERAVNVTPIQFRALGELAQTTPSGGYIPQGKEEGLRIGVFFVFLQGYFKVDSGLFWITEEFLVVRFEGNRFGHIVVPIFRGVDFNCLIILNRTVRYNAQKRNWESRNWCRGQMFLYKVSA